jgi:hypothetical protein
LVRFAVVGTICARFFFGTSWQIVGGTKTFVITVPGLLQNPKSKKFFMPNSRGENLTGVPNLARERARRFLFVEILFSRSGLAGKSRRDRINI